VRAKGQCKRGTSLELQRGVSLSTDHDGNEMDTTRAEELVSHLADVVDLPPYDESNRLILSRTPAITSLHFAAAVRRLCESCLPLGAAMMPSR